MLCMQAIAPLLGAYRKISHCQYLGYCRSAATLNVMSVHLSYAAGTLDKQTASLSNAAAERVDMGGDISYSGLI